MEPLRAAGIEPVIGHAAGNVPAGAEVVYSTAIAPETRSGGRPAAQLHRSELLAQIAALKRCLAVTGTHGKTTTTAMIVHVAARLRHGPGVRRRRRAALAPGSNAGWGSGEWIVIEADESDRSLLNYTPEIAVLTNAELDHHATYSLAARPRARRSREFTGRAGDNAVVWDRPELLRSLPAPGAASPTTRRAPQLTPAGARFTWRGRECSWRSRALTTRSTPPARSPLRAGGRRSRRWRSPRSRLPGRAPPVRASRRDGAGARVYDDYAHHPTEVAAAIAAARDARARAGWSRCSSRTCTRAPVRSRAEFGAALAAADVVVVLDVYPARERAEDFPGRRRAAGGRRRGRRGRRPPVAWMPELADARAGSRATLRAGTCAW